ncbi:hypothetical protein [Rufibacter ruber]|uniref:hypothetical protein n=1 Tax=Rufibacter ruber TaxID=1783499 RepID=UPI0012906CB6|nr:hypothetical protein [Rufibacter ruber]
MDFHFVTDPEDRVVAVHDGFPLENDPLRDGDGGGVGEVFEGRFHFKLCQEVELVFPDLNE